MRMPILAVITSALLLSSALAYFAWASWIWVILSGILFIIATHDVIQRRHSILRNFPVLGHFRFMLEALRPEIQQYFVESDIANDPIARIYRNVVYQKAKGDLETVPFGSELDFYSDEYQWVNHSSFPVEIENSDFRVMIGNEQCRQPYSASLLNISAMSYGSISHAAVTALGAGARKGGFYLNTGEGGLAPYHLDSGADLVLQLGTAYFGMRDQDGYFDPQLFQQKSRLPQVKMIEIKISQGAKPAHGGILPGIKVTEEVARIRHVKEGKSVISPPGHTAFTTPNELCQFIFTLRELSDGKPIGFKLSLGRREEFTKICDSMKELQIYPDFITVDGGEGGTGAAPFDFLNFVGSPLKEALHFVDNTLQEYGLRDKVKIIASGKIFTAYDMFEKLALGADLCNSARGMMLALGCIQAYRCNTNRCPTGVATTDPRLIAGLDIADKTERVFNYHRRTLSSVAELIGAVGIHSPEEVELQHISRRWNGRILTLNELFGRVSKLTIHEQKDRSRIPKGEPKAPTPPEEP